MGIVLKNLLRRKVRTLLTILGIAIGVASIISLGAMADGLRSGYSSLMTESKADLVLTQPDAFDVSYSAVDTEIEHQLRTLPEVKTISGMLEGFVSVEGQPFFIVFGYPTDSFVLDKYQIIDGESIFTNTIIGFHGNPILLGSAAAEALNKTVGDTLRIQTTNFRVAGVFQTGDAFEDSSGLMRLADAQELLSKPRQVSLYYIQLKESWMRDRLEERVKRTWKDLMLSGTSEYAKNQTMYEMLNVFVWILGGLAILIGGVTMMNAQLMSVYERTREIGVLRAVGWTKNRVLWMILGESLVVCILGGVLGFIIAWALLYGLSNTTTFFGTSSSNIRLPLLLQSSGVVMLLGMVGGYYPAWKASRLLPIEALRYEGGSSGQLHRLPFGGMELQSLWQRSSRTILTLVVIGMTVGSIMTLDGVMGGFSKSFNELFLGSDAEVMIRQADIADTSLSAVDERTGAKIAAMPEVKKITGMVITAITSGQPGGFFLVQGYAPNDFLIKRFNIAEGKPLSGNHQLLLGRIMANSLKKNVGDTIDLSGIRFRIVGIYESNAGWEQMGGVVTLRDGQKMVGRPRKVTMYFVKLMDKKDASMFVENINNTYPELHAALSGEFMGEMPDMENMDGMMAMISVVAILIGGVGVLNTMLMSVMERTREIGVLRALGWRRQAIMKMIIKEAAILGIFGGIAGFVFALLLGFLLGGDQIMGGTFAPLWSMDVFARAFIVAFLLGIVGGLYPALRATRLSPTEALRYE